MIGTIKILTALILGLGSIVYWRFFLNRLKINPLIVLFGIFFLRVSLSLLLHPILEVKYPSDIPIFYDHATRILNGEIPTFDFSFPYGIFMGYLMAFSLVLFNSPISIIILFHIAEFIGLLFFFKILKLLYNKEIINNFFVLYFLNPISFINLGVAGQDESIIILVVSLFLYAATFPGYKSIYLGILSLFITKLMALMCLVGYFIREKLLRSGIFIGALFILFGGLIFLDFKVIDFNVAINSNINDALLSKITSGNLWFFLKLLGLDYTESVLPMLVTLFSFVLLIGYFYFFKTADSILQTYVFVTILLFLFFGLFYKMTFSQYYAVILPLLLLLFMQTGLKRSLFYLFIIWSILLSVETSLFFVNKYYIGINNIKLLMVLVYQGLILLANFYLIIEVIKLSSRKNIFQIK